MKGAGSSVAEVWETWGGWESAEPVNAAFPPWEPVDPNRSALGNVEASVLLTAEEKEQ